jgi:phage baseplate assembly protein W
MAIYKGFSTIGTELIRKWSVVDEELVKSDLRMHLFTRPGERVMRPLWGCKIWDYFMDPMSSRDNIIQEAIKVVNAEPRVRLININVFDFDHGIRLEIELEFITTGVVETMLVEFDSRDAGNFGTSL